MLNLAASGFNTIIGSTAGSWNIGTSVTPGNNVKGSWATVHSGAAVTSEVWYMYININSNSVSAAARDTLVDIGVDDAGGTSFTSVIDNLMGSCAGRWGFAGGGQHYFFPLKIKSGASIGARASVNNATVGTLRVYIKLFCDPIYPTMCRRGTYVRTYGATTGSSTGTAITPGTSAAEGSWTSVGTVADDDIWWWQQGFGCNNATMTNLCYMSDLARGDGSNKHLIIENEVFMFGTNEQLIRCNYPYDFFTHRAKNGDGVYMRMSCSGTPVTGISGIAYGLGGFA